MAYGEKTGIGGWLLVFLITYAAGMALSLAGTMYQLFFTPAWNVSYPGQATLRLVLCGVLVAQTVAVSVVIWRLLRVRNWWTVKLTIAILWLSPFVGRAIATVGAIAIYGAFMQRASLVITYAAAQVAYSGLWTGYFLVSKRIANTYRWRTDDDLATTFA